MFFVIFIVINNIYIYILNLVFNFKSNNNSNVKHIYLILLRKNIDIIKNIYKNIFLIKYKYNNKLINKSTSIDNYLNINLLKQFTVLFLRKNKVFNKGRYSRNRQYYRTGVYWCLYLNVILMVGLYFWFYKISMVFSYIWWFFFIFLLSFFIPKIVQYNLYYPYNIFNTIIFNIKFLVILLYNIVDLFFTLLKKNYLYKYLNYYYWDLFFIFK